MGLCQVRQRLEKVFLELFVRQLCKLSAKVPICKLLHVPRVVTADFFALDAFVEQFSIELAHQAKTGAHEVPILLE